jgi:hypothetical protein
MTFSSGQSPLRKIEYADERYNDVYDLFVDASCNLVYAIRYLDGDRTDPIHYDCLSDMNPYHQRQIEEILWRMQRKSK